ncbi:rhodanese-like domain-containing protein [Stenotrophobium rhamnosiphilum]|uniref:Sulfurtransferase n=1 Tax=Stenotrophobium rhamnosiphilum TaxID=2029166 RepID=A0A2T5MJQ4_9GAMM|nr:rhodanese-like domain-containing protein [Stenotrophobium rhamnosiphilum]PTU32794.1 sulfurtransferase [Stenotrophobium rhamnosiphilum]
MQNLTPQEFKDRMAQGVAVLDVRTPEEVEIAALSGAINIPMNELPTRLGELDSNAPIAVLCHHGMRSEMASRFLERNGFADVAHLVGGIDAWSASIDTSVPRY